MKEIGGYIELDTYQLPMLHAGAIALNCGRNGLAYLIRSRKIKKIKIPYFICKSILDVCDIEKVYISYYHIDSNFRPVEVKLDENEWLYFVNYYGQFSNQEIQQYVEKYKRVIVDQTNAYFQEPLPHVDTIYSCRKWFGVADGAFLYTDYLLADGFPIDVSFDRMRFLLGRYERSASEFYEEYKENNKFFATEPIKYMSKLTRNLLHAINYKEVQKRRERNYHYLNQRLKSVNQIQLKPASFMYPFMVTDGVRIRKTLREKQIYVPILWPTVFELTNSNDIEYKMAENILPLPIDQRYDTSDMNYIIQEVLKCIN